MGNFKKREKGSQAYESQGKKFFFHTLKKHPANTWDKYLDPRTEDWD